MNLEVKWLEDFLLLAATRSFSQAAQRRFVTQPAFSRRIRALEEEVGVQLVDRSTTPVELTAEGQVFLLTARNVVEQLKASVQHLRGLQPGESQLVEMVVAHSLALSFVPNWLSSLQVQLQGLCVRVVAMNVGDAIHALREGQFDLMLIYADPQAALQLDPELFPSLQLAATEMVPVSRVQEGELLFDLNQQSAPLPLLAYTQGAFLERSLRMLIKHQDLQLRLRTVYETAMAEGLKGMAVAGLGLAWLPLISVEQELANGTLAVCEGEQWRIPLQVRLYRCAPLHKPSVEQLWRHLQRQAPRGQ
ncbi:LysR substrate-binding domain-containing protein [Balneatrix alpica]|uniref:LysR substrate-binding domain-containing protein n=1 Tax=Balneatrix alpica TaxID=75684 RepID=A0ABV5Z9Q5_9GAMM|nr:LysR substrate-binding domain-containing protein [Balneatrix alpica]